MFQIIPKRDIPLWVDVLNKAFEQEHPEIEVTAGEVFKEMRLIDDLLVLQKSQCLLTRKKGLKTIMDARISKELGLPYGNMNRI